MGINGPAHRPAHLGSSRTPLLRIEPDHPRLDYHSPGPEAAGGISLPPTIHGLPSKRGNDLRTPAARVKPARPSSFPASARSRCRTYPAGIAACLADCDLDLLQKRLVARIDPRATAARPTRSDPKTLTVIACHLCRFISDAIYDEAAGTQTRQPSRLESLRLLSRTT